MFWSILITALLLILFVPFPVKLRIFYCEGILNFYLYKFKINIFKLVKKKEKSDEKIKKNKKEEFDLRAIPKIVHKFNLNPFKPTLRLKLCLDYGIDDAAATAISYGLLNTADPFINQVLSIVFKIKKYKTTFIPEFNKFTLKADMNSIIFISLAKIIYMSIIAFKAFKLLKKPVASKISCNNA